MEFDFTSVIDRRGRDAVAVDVDDSLWRLPPGGARPGFDRIPLWIADMCFPTAPSVTRRLLERINHPIFGYFTPSEEYCASILGWQRESFGVDTLQREDISGENGVLCGVANALRVLSEPGEAVLLHAPVYNGFTSLLAKNGYRAVFSPLRPDGQGVPRMDYADMEERILRYHIRTAIFCSPHNPTGRVWEREELQEAMSLFRRHDVYVISDEIWSDLALYGHRHIPLYSLSDDARSRTVALYAPSKTFNLAGLTGSYRLTFNTRLRHRLDYREAQGHFGGMNVLFMHALIGAYSPEGRAWMEGLKAVLERNIDLACDFFAGIDGVTIQKPQGTYVILPDVQEWCGNHGMTPEELAGAGAAVGVLWRDGRVYRAPRAIRLTLGLPGELLREALDRLRVHVFQGEERGTAARESL